MKIIFQISFFLLGLIIIVLAKKKDDQITKITITTTEDIIEEEPIIEEEEEIETKIEPKKNNTNNTNTNTKQNEEKIVPVIPKKRDNAQSNVEKMVQKAKKDARETTTEKSLILIIPYEDNEDYTICAMGFGTPANFIPLQVETTSYKTWILSILNEDYPSIYSYNLRESSTGKESGDWDSVIDEEGKISGNVILDKVYLGKYKLDKFKFIEAVEFEESFNDFKNGKLGLGNCKYAIKGEKDYCLLQRLKDNGSIDRKIFSLRELSDTHGELVIGNITAESRDKDYPLLNVVNEDIYNDLEDEVFRMSWIVKATHVIFRNNNDNIKNIFDNNIHLKNGFVSFDSSCHYIEAPYSYINDFEDQMFDVYYDNVCRKVNRDGVYMFLCDKERYDENKNKDLNFIIVLNGYGFEIPMNSLFEKTSEDDYEFFIHFREFEQNVWNLGHPFFHYYTVIFDEENQEIGIDGDMIYSLQDEAEAALKKEKAGGKTRIFLWILFGLLLLIGLFYFSRRMGINQRISMGVNRSLVDNESVDDISFVPGENVH